MFTIVFHAKPRLFIAQGLGVMVLEDGSHYEGELKDGFLAGKGVLTFCSGDR